MDVIISVTIQNYLDTISQATTWLIVRLQDRKTATQAVICDHISQYCNIGNHREEQIRNVSSLQISQAPPNLTQVSHEV